MSDAIASFRLRQVLAFAAVYVIWGSTYLAIRFAIETLPVFTMAGVRFLLAGGILFAWASWRGERLPPLRQWRAAAIMGGLLLLGGNGAVVWAEQKLSSGLAALLVGTEPLWVAMIFWMLPSGRRPTLRVATGLLVGFGGAALLALTAENVGGGAPHLPSILVLLIGCLSWASGSLYGRTADLPSSPLLATGMQMLAGGSLLLGTGALAGEWSKIEPATFSTTSLLAFAYLVVFGAIIAFSAYTWLVRNTEPTLVATYAYVNPVVAVFLGWLWGGEPLGSMTFIAMALILGAVILVGSGSSENAPAQPAKTVELRQPVASEVIDLGRESRYAFEKCA